MHMTFDLKRMCAQGPSYLGKGDHMERSFTSNLQARFGAPQAVSGAAAEVLITSGSLGGEALDAR